MSNSKAKYFMGLAELAATQSTDPRTKVGACVVNINGKVSGIGYNRMPDGCEDFTWERKKGTIHNKLLFVCHAEMNAILATTPMDAKHGTIYVTLFPCNECAKLLIQTGIKEVVYKSDSKAAQLEFQASRKMLTAAKIKITSYENLHIF